MGVCECVHACVRYVLPHMSLQTLVSIVTVFSCPPLLAAVMEVKFFACAESKAMVTAVIFLLYISFLKWALG